MVVSPPGATDGLQRTIVQPQSGFAVISSGLLPAFLSRKVTELVVPARTSPMSTFPFKSTACGNERTSCEGDDWVGTASGADGAPGDGIAGLESHKGGDICAVNAIPTAPSPANTTAICQRIFTEFYGRLIYGREPV
jgi:hypothetical protein